MVKWKAYIWPAHCNKLAYCDVLVCKNHYDYNGWLNALED